MCDINSPYSHWIKDIQETTWRRSQVDSLSSACGGGSTSCGLGIGHESVVSSDSFGCDSFLVRRGSEFGCDVSVVIYQ